ncbi:hypothetical protein J2X46_000825 [Nocardioides sp. BE266]|uniref:pilus assembly protein TadG-related protein n=1 Tax=Nocardioides sp. BE266 TaxID=2817725 RepID=UPI00285EAB24|nr:pilus assembly protein TadG-related protein [Nocardioides sp. BE266]MDR7251853.1 hypothetical protein [Nocardioides sp. BE266]
MLHLTPLTRIARRRDEIGAVAIVVAMFFAFVAVPLGAVSIDIARLYVELQRVQAAADAAATAGVTFMPDDFANAKARAIEVAEDNGFPNSGTSAVAVAIGEKPTQLKVTVSSTVSNAFAKSFGISSSTMSRSAVADFNGPAPMGSPCNTFANEPAGSAQLGPSASVLKQPTYADCADPQFWGAIAGPETYKGQGAEFETRKCGGGEDLCAGGSGSANLEFDPRGFIYLVRVGSAGVGQSIQLQIYDPAYVETASSCSSSSGPTGGISSSDNYRYPYSTTDANNRYNNSANSFCTGDSDNNGNRFGSSDVPTITSFALRNKVDNLNPYSAPALNPSQCTKQFPGYSYTSSTAWTTSHLRDSNNTSGKPYNVDLARVFHQWVDLCTFTPTAAGDYYIQVRSNVALPSTYTLDSTGAVVGNSAVVSQTGDDTSVQGNGTNNFALRAISGAPAGAVSVAPWERMRIYANSDAATTEFNLVRVVPAAANKTLVVSFFDVGEGASSGSVTILKPNDSNMPSSIAGCKASGVVTGALTGCKITGITPTNNNGKYQEIRIPIPNTYTCQVSSQGGCWFRVQVSFGTGTVHDATTWTARIVGEPVRLIE